MRTKIANRNARFGSQVRLVNCLFFEYDCNGIRLYFRLMIFIYESDHHVYRRDILLIHAVQLPLANCIKQSGSKNRDGGIIITFCVHQILHVRYNFNCLRQKIDERVYLDRVNNFD